MKKQKMSLAILSDGLKKFWQKGVSITNHLDERTHGWLGILANAFDQNFKAELSDHSCCNGHFSILSLFPLTLLSIVIASFSLGPLMDQQVIIFPSEV